MIGKIIGKYRIVGQLGRGAMGTVFKAIDETLDRDVAIKVLNPELADAKFIKRFQKEATTLAKLNHPEIATIYELFRSDTDLLMVMEYVPGETLEMISNRVGPLSPERAAYLADRLLSALAYAHDAGIVHCDIKPANVIVTEHGEVKIMDFGVARVQGAGHMSLDGYMVGTPAYMAPEQVLGQVVDKRADLYSVGVVLYRLLTGALPFKADTASGMVRKQLSGRPTPLRGHREGLPDWCDPILQRALEKRPADRFQTADEFREALAGASGMLAADPTAGPSPLASIVLPVSTAGLPSAIRRARASAATVKVTPNAGSDTVGPAQVSVGFVGPLLGVVAANILLVALVAAPRIVQAPSPAAIVISPQPASTSRAPEATSTTAVSAAVPAVSTPAVPAVSTPAVPAVSKPTVTALPASAVTTVSARMPVAAPRFTTPVVFEAQALTADGQRRKMQDAKVVLADGNIHVQASKPERDLWTIPYPNVLSISYSQGRDPQWRGRSGPARVARADGGVFGIFRATRHWVSLRITDPDLQFVPLLFSTEARARRAVAALEQRTGRRAQIVVKREGDN